MNTRFAVAAHILTYLACQECGPATSEAIASSVGTNPALIRRIGAQLVRAGLITAQRGTGGGATLGRPARQITLLDIHRAVDENADVIPVHRTANRRCSVGRHMQRVLEQHCDAAERALERELARTTIAALAAEVAAGAPRAALAAG